jgi:hypothetical protein
MPPNTNNRITGTIASRDRRRRRILDLAQRFAGQSAERLRSTGQLDLGGVEHRAETRQVSEARQRAR